MKLSSVVAIAAGCRSAAAWGGMFNPNLRPRLSCQRQQTYTQTNKTRRNATKTTHAGFGHITVAYIASNFVSSDTASYFQGLLHNSTEDYLAGVASWADSVRYTKWGRFSANFHFIDAKDDPPRSCGIVMARDCKADGCVVSAIHNYTTRLLDASLPASERAIAAKFVVHFVGDTHQPLHNEDVARGGNGIHVKFNGVDFNLHHVWDSSIAEKLVGGVRRAPYAEARRWADALTAEINTGKFNASRLDWLQDVDLEDPTATALAWASEANAYVCTKVLPEGPEAIRGQELGSEYYEAAAPVVELQIAKAGYRLAAWLDLIAARTKTQQAVMGDL
ncbi:S1/P1 nuclease-domain-containing protein [Cercophora newfieldiana]|uniref:S1/P1 nuclease-domain-containing protein n=1 Tax=Cercophora newfieldiana TaxID=92897 RepID=A0AA40D0I8_9PEZI|nr:S1/P1 nuclease-domain-containing protein [Cercophora newfieldiana]